MANRPTKYVFVTGGVLSGLGKGITAASIGNLLKARGFKVNIQKCDPYLNVDAGTLNPREHGECFVTKDGAETDLDLGHYERFLDEELTQKSSLMAGRILRKVIDDERLGLYEGHTVQIIPHVTNAVQEYIRDSGKDFDVQIVEIGGTVGDFEGLSFIEAIREFGLKVAANDCAYVHIVYLPYLGASQETKTKPAQNSVRELRSLGIAPDILIARSESPANPNVKHKLSLFCGVDEASIALLPNAETIYEVPLTLEDTGIGEALCQKLNLRAHKPELKAWRNVVKKATTDYSDSVTVGIVAKYMDNQDTYMCVFEALRAAAWNNNCKLTIRWIDAAELETNPSSISQLRKVDGIVVPGGFGIRGLNGKVRAAQYCLAKKVPYLGLCLGLQMAVVGAARSAGLKEATSTEIDPSSPHQVIHTMADQAGKENTGGTMRLGNYPCNLNKDSLSAKLYGKRQIIERHRHRYECNNAYRELYESWGIKAVGISPDGILVEMIEAINHPFFIASQFHPEFTSRPNRPHPLFNGFVVKLLQSQQN